jgi:putative membrane protein
MINYDPKNWFGLIFHAYSAQVFRRLFPALMGLGMFSAAICWVELIWLDAPLNMANTVHSLLGFVLSLFLVFRTNTAYDRWWEGRKQWGALVNVSRTLAQRIRLVDDVEGQTVFRKGIPGFAEALRDHLRSEDAARPDSHPSLAHAPNAWVASMAAQAAIWHKNGTISDHKHWLLENNFERLTDILGACERILKTPIPYSYSMFMKKFIFLYAITLPIGFVGTFFWWTIPVVMAVFYILVSIELIAEEIEDPFGTDENDLPLNALCNTIESSCSDLLAT